MTPMASAYTLEFEKPLLELERQIDDLKRIGTERQIDIEGELQGLQGKLDSLRAEIYRNLTPIQRVMVARHPRRPYTLDYLSTIFTDFIELHGDRLYLDDPAVVGGWARLGGSSVMVVGHQKGRDTKENLKRNFGMPHPEGYRKALRLMRLAAKFSAPVITLIDTPGAYPGLGAEERGQSEALARNILEMSMLPTQTIAVVIGEGGSGGALALGVADRILMLENSVYSVISPEGCAAILWKDSAAAPTAARALKIDARSLLELGVVDGVVPEPPGGAETDHPEAAALVRAAIRAELSDLASRDPSRLVADRRARFRRFGGQSAPAPALPHPGGPQ
jgi:acetyl-CoA carboxylase carboxyl transferase alpha subunit